MRFKHIIIFGVALMLLGSTSLLAFPSNVPPTKAELMAKKFVFKRLADTSNAILTSGKVRHFLFVPFLDNAALRKSGVLSETIGLTMVYAAMAGDRPLFDSQVKLLNKSFLGPYGLFHWLVSHDGKTTANVSAIVDDLRIAYALIESYKRWNAPQYLAMAKQISRNILQHEVVGHRLCDFLNWRDAGEPVQSKTIQLSYIDTMAMRALAAHDPAWTEVLAQSGEILAKGQLESGLFYEKFELETDAYSGTNQNVINQFYCALFSIQYPVCQKRFMVWLKDRFAQDGKIYAEYNVITGEPTRFYESTSVYALAARYARLTGESELEKRLLSKLLSFQNQNRWSPMYGGFYDDEVYSFDNLEALITLRFINEGR